jgi:RNA polymerase-binding transcription factor DksA
MTNRAVHDTCLGKQELSSKTALNHQVKAMKNKNTKKDELNDLELRVILEERRAVLLSRLRVKQPQQLSPVSENPDRSDLAQDYFSKERHAALVDQMEDALEQIEAALTRLDRGTYGKCVRCGQEISNSRLKVLPSADKCIQCVKAVDSEQVNFGTNYG